MGFARARNIEQTGMNKKYIVRLTGEERKHLEEFVSKGKRAAYKIKHANILLKADADGPGWADEAIAEAFSAHEHTVRNVRQRFVEQGLNAALERKKQSAPSRKPILDRKSKPICWPLRVANRHKAMPAGHCTCLPRRCCSAWKMQKI